MNPEYESSTEADMDSSSDYDPKQKQVAAPIKAKRPKSARRNLTEVTKKLDDVFEDEGHIFEPVPQQPVRDMIRVRMEMNDLNFATPPMDDSFIDLKEVVGASWVHGSKRTLVLIFRNGGKMDADDDGFLYYASGIRTKTGYHTGTWKRPTDITDIWRFLTRKLEFGNSSVWGTMF